MLPSHKKETRRVNKTEYDVKKRHPPKSSTLRSKNDFFITRKTNIQSQTKKIASIIERNAEQVVIHGLGASLNKALVLSLELQKYFMGAVQFHTTTSTVKVTDDLFPLSDECELGMRDRPISAVHITFFPNRAC